MLNVVAIMGRLVADPELRTTPAGVNVCQFRIACDRNFARQGEQRQADFVDIVAWRAQADFVCKYFSKGRPLPAEAARCSKKNTTDFEPHRSRPRFLWGFYDNRIEWFDFIIDILR